MYGDWLFVGATGKDLFHQYARFFEPVAYGCEPCRLYRLPGEQDESRGNQPFWRQVGNDGAYSRLYPCAGNAPKHLANEAPVRERQYPSYLYRFHRMRSGLRQSYQILHYRLERVAVRTLSGFTTGYGRFHHARFRYDRCVSVSGCASPSRYALDESRPFG